MTSPTNTHASGLIAWPEPIQSGPFVSGESQGVESRLAWLRLLESGSSSKQRAFLLFPEVEGEGIRSLWGALRPYISSQTMTFPEQVSWSDSSTAPRERLPGIDEEIRGLFTVAKEEIFESGMDSEFSRGLLDFVTWHSNAGIEAIADLILSGKADPDVANQALRLLGRIHDPLSYLKRFRLLTDCLKSSSLYLRDGAILGLAFMDDPSAIPFIKRAIEQEKIDELRYDMEKVLAQLEDTLLENKR